MWQGGHVWQRGACVAGGIAGEHGRGCAWQEGMCGRGVHGRGMHAVHTPLSDTTATAYGQ